MNYLNGLIQKKKKNEKITVLTAYDYISAKIVDEAGIDIILVGDSYGMVKLGYKNTLPVTIEEMLIVSKAVSRAVNNSILIIDMPFLSYQPSERDAVLNTGIFLKETKAQAVKIESLESNVDLIEKLVRLDIPVMGHIGLTPQSINRHGGYKIQGKEAGSAKILYHLAKRLEQAGVCSIVLEGMTAECAGKITQDINVPTIGIGAGPYCDGQVLVLDDLIGMNAEFTPRHGKKYANVHDIIKKAVLNYQSDVKTSKFPEGENYSKMDKKELGKFNVE